MGTSWMPVRGLTGAAALTSAGPEPLFSIAWRGPYCAFVQRGLPYSHGGDGGAERRPEPRTLSEERPEA